MLQAFTARSFRSIRKGALSLASFSSDLRFQFKNMVEMQKHASELHAKRPYLGTRNQTTNVWQWTTFEEFGDRVNDMTAALQNVGVQHKDPVAVISNNREEWAVTAYATYARGAYWVPMYEAQNPNDWRYILEDSQAKVLFVANRSIFEKVRHWVSEISSLQHVFCFENEDGSNMITTPDNGKAVEDSSSYAHLMNLGSGRVVAPFFPEPSDLLSIFYTSGTTANPKGVLITHDNIAQNVQGLYSVIPSELLAPSYRSLGYLPWAHCYGQTAELHTMMAHGCSIGIVDNIQRLVDYLPEVKPSVMMNVPTLFNRVYSRVMETRGQMTGVKAFLFDKALHYGKEMIPYVVENRENEVPFSTYLPYTILNHLVLDKIRERFGGNLKYATCGGAGCPQEVLEFMWGIGIPVLEGYGLTETSPMVTVNVFEKGGRLKLGTVGTPLSNVEVLIGDPNEEGEGEILVHGPNVMQGYHNLPHETKSSFITLEGKKYFRTGDLGRIITEKRMIENKEKMVDFLKVTGRVKEQYKLENGKYVVPAPLEDKIQLSTFIAQAVLYGDNRESNIVMIVVDEITLKNWRESQGMTGNFSFEEELEKEEVIELIRCELKKVLSYLPSYAKPKRFFFIPYLFTPDNGFATPKLSIKRPRVFKHFSQEIEDCYTGEIGYDI